MYLAKQLAWLPSGAQFALGRKLAADDLEQELEYLDVAPSLLQVFSPSIKAVVTD